jgi:hypothetical protein
MERQRNEMFRYQYRERQEREGRGPLPESGHGKPANGFDRWKGKDGERRQSGQDTPTFGLSAGLTAEEVRSIMANSIRKPSPSVEQAKDVRTDTGHDRDDEGTRGMSMSR